MPSDDLVMSTDTRAIEQAARALVYLTVEWSMPERLVRPLVQSAIRSLPDIGFQFFAVQEDGPVTAPWLKSHGWLRGPTGAGSLIWFEHGKPVAEERAPGKVGAKAIARKTVALWGLSTE